MPQLSLPAGPADLTPEWFTTLFREQAMLPSGAVTGIQVETIGQDRGFTGMIARVQLQSTYQETPSSLVVKLPLAERASYSAYRASLEKDETATQRYFERCAREVLFYQQIAPLNALRTPRLYYGAVDETEQRLILVLEDLESMRPGDALHGCSPERAALVIDRLADFHAQWWNHPLLETFPWLPAWGGDEYQAQDRYVRCLVPFLQRSGSHLSASTLNIMDALVTNYASVRTRLRLAPVTLVHADLHLDNMLFPSHENESEVIVIDWQSVACGRGVLDLALFLFESLETSTRRACENDLLRRYHARLCAKGVADYSFSQLIEDCRFALLWLAGTKVVWSGSLDVEQMGEREQALIEASVGEDSFAALLDYDAGSLLPLQG